MGHQLAQCDRTLRGPQSGLALGIEPLQHLWCGKIGQQLANRRFKGELALFDELHRRCRRDRFGHRGDPEHAIGRHVVWLGQVAFAERALIDHLGAAGGYGDDAGNFHGIAFLAQYLIDLSFAMHGVPPGYFLKWLIFRRRISCRNRSGTWSRSRDRRSRALWIKAARAIIFDESGRIVGNIRLIAALVMALRETGL